MIWTRVTQSENESTGVLTPTTTTISGSGIKVRGYPDTYRSLGLIESASPTVLFIPTTYGDRIKEGDTTVFASENYVAKDCYHIEPDGVVLATRVVMVR